MTFINFFAFGSFDAHLYNTMIDETVPMSLRVTVAKQLMHSACGQLRSRAYWWTQNKKNFEVHNVTYMSSGKSVL